MDLLIFNVSSEFAWNLKPSEECLSANYKDIRSVSFISGFFFQSGQKPEKERKTQIEEEKGYS